MSLSLDYITMPPKSQEASQIQVQEITKLEHENQQLAAQYQSQVKHNSEQTIRRTKAENEELKNDEKQKKQKKKQKQKQDGTSKGSDKPNEKNTLDSTSHFDMRI